MMEAWTKNQRKIETSSAELRLDDEIIEKRNPGENWRFFFGGRGGRSVQKPDLPPELISGGQMDLRADN